MTTTNEPSGHPAEERLALPDRLSTNPQSPFYNGAVLAHAVGVRFNGTEKTNVEEYCVSEGWIKVAAGKSRDRRGNPLTIKLKGAVVPYYRDTPEGKAPESNSPA